MENEPQKKGECRAIKTTRNGNPLFDGTQGIETRFKPGVPKTEKEKEAIRQGMHDAKARRERDAIIFGKATLELIKRIEEGTINTKDLNDAINNAADRLGDKVNKQEILGSLGIEKIFVTPEEVKETDKHIDDVINDGLEL